MIWPSFKPAGEHGESLPLRNGLRLRTFYSNSEPKPDAGKAESCDVMFVARMNWLPF
jgi:hypothetical protein